MRRYVAIAVLTMSATLARGAEVQAPAGRLPDSVQPTHYQLTLTIDPRQSEFSGETVIDVEIRRPLSTIWLHGLGLKVASASVTSGARTVAAHYEEVDHETGVARLSTGETLPAGKAVLNLTYTAPFQDSPQGLYRTRVGQDWYAFTQFEAIDARRAFPGFDEPRFKTPYDVSVTTSGGDLAVSNAPQAAATPSGTGTVYRYRATKPLPTYLVAFAVGPLEVLQGAVPPNAVRREPLPLRVIGTRGNPQRFQFALAQAPELIRRLELYFGMPFPYAKIDLIASPIHGGAMENAGAIIFDENLLAFGPEPTPREASSFGMVAAHELSHQWFGDLVTPAWWDDIWLNESFAEWMGSKIGDEWRPQLGIEQEQLDNTLQAMNTDALRAGRPIHQAVETNLQIATTFDDITYEKGAGVIGMVESYLGPERFQRGVRLHLARHAYGTATAEEFFHSMAEGSGDRAVVDAFESFVNQPGVPLVSVRAAADGSLALAQSRYQPLGPSGEPGIMQWKIPFCADFHAADARPVKQCVMLSGPTGSLAVPASLRGATVHPNAGGAGYYRFTVDPALSQALLAMAARLPPRESVTLADSTSAALDAGRLPFADFYRAAQTLADHSDRTTALSLGYRLWSLHDRLAGPAERALLERALVALYGERLRRLGYDATPGHYATDPPEQQLLRRELLALVGSTAGDPAVRAALTPVAERSLADPSQVDPLLRRWVWAVGLEERGAPLLARLKTLATSEDAQVRLDAGLALGSAGPALSNEVLDFTLDPALDPGTVFRITFRQMTSPSTRAQAWSWLGTHQAALLARVPVFFQYLLADVGNSFCSAAERQSFETVLGNKLRGLNGGEIAVARVIESIDDCAALRAALGDSIRTTLEQALR
ncbi:MAG TPA: M1 family metallopeptidase [Steroidobacteraceae bacterium]|nr:M1 family metallopeptidase [Steroidobacteraceae bacterium]